MKGLQSWVGMGKAGTAVMCADEERRRSGGQDQNCGVIWGLGYFARSLGRWVGQA
jgi:hypothetical protein